MISLEIEGFEEFAKKLDRISNKFEKEVSKEVMKQGNRLLRRVKQKTPVAFNDGGTLRRSWKIKKISETQVMISNNVEYAPHVEFGHRTRLGKRKKQNPNYKSSGVAVVPGVFMLQRSAREVQKDFKKSLKEIIANSFKG